jgi:hypothetical protein
VALDSCGRSNDQSAGGIDCTVVEPATSRDFLDDARLSGLATPFVEEVDLIVGRDDQSASLTQGDTSHGARRLPPFLVSASCRPPIDQTFETVDPVQALTPVVPYWVLSDHAPVICDDAPTEVH